MWLPYCAPAEETITIYMINNKKIEFCISNSVTGRNVNQTIAENFPSMTFRFSFCPEYTILNRNSHFMLKVMSICVHKVTCNFILYIQIVPRLNQSAWNSFELRGKWGFMPGLHSARCQKDKIIEKWRSGYFSKYCLVVVLFACLFLSL